MYVKPKKLCPFRKIIQVTDYHWEGDHPLPMVYEESFCECLEDQCAVYNTNHSCYSHRCGLRGE